jgi:hypothetical protein
MANTPESIALLWKRLEEKKVKVPPEVWVVWQGACTKELQDIREIVGRNQGQPIPAADAELIGRKVYLVQKFVRSTRRTSDGVSRVQDDRIHLEDNVRELVAHYIGNDLYKVSLIADIYGVNPAPLPPEHGELILKNINAIMEFIELLKSKTGQAT